MKNEIKILIAAIVVILIILVGAFALSGSNNPQPSATPTAVPVTATPTPVPANGGSTATATPAPTVAPTATPTPTPTPVPESGVKQTEFGYWITYPPLDPQKWSTNPPPAQNGGNIVYFDPTSGIMNLNDVNKNDVSAETPSVWSGDYHTAIIHRSPGDLNATVNVTIHMSTSSNIQWITYGHYTSVGTVPYNYLASMHCYDPGNFTELGEGEYKVVFGPGVTQQTLCIHIDPYAPAQVPQVIQVPMPEGWVKLTITGTDGGYGIDWARKDYLLTIKALPSVYFGDFSGGVWWNGTAIRYEGGFLEMHNDSSPAIAYFVIPVYRSGNSASSLLIADLGKYVDGMPADAVKLVPFDFGAGVSTSYLAVGIQKSYIMNDTDAYVHIDIPDTDEYTAGWYDTFDIYINDYK